MPPRSAIQMSAKSAYVNSDILLNWLCHCKLQKLEAHWVNNYLPQTEVTMDDEKNKEVTLGKLLETLSPVSQTVENITKTARNVASIFNSSEDISHRREINERKNKQQPKRKLLRQHTKKRVKTKVIFKITKTNA